MQEYLSCNVVAQRLGLRFSSLARWIRQARIDSGQVGPRDHDNLTSEERTELNRLRKENRELKRVKDFSGWRQRTLPWPGGLPRRRGRRGRRCSWLYLETEHG